MIQELWQNWMANLPYGSFLGKDYVLAIAIIIFAVIFAKLLQFIFANYLERFAKKTKTKLDDLIFEKTKRPLFYLVLVCGLRLSLEIMGFVGLWTRLIDSLVAIVFVFMVARVIDVIINVWGKAFAKKTKTHLDEVLMPLFHKFTSVVFVIIAIMWVLKIWQINITPYLAGVGISGLVLGLALQDSLRNVFGGVSLMLDQTFKIGDKIKLESGEIGEVEDVGLRSTKLRTYDNELINIPNGYLANSKIQNYTRPNPKIRVTVDFGVEYGSDVKKVSEIVLAEIKQMKEVLIDPEPSVRFLSMDDSALAFKAFFWVDNWQEAYNKKLEATELIYNILNKKKIGIPYPTTTVHLVK